MKANYKAVGVSFKIEIKSIQLDLGKSITTQMDGMITGTTRWDYGPAEVGKQITSTLDSPFSSVLALPDSKRAKKRRK